MSGILRHTPSTHTGLGALASRQLFSTADYIPQGSISEISHEVTFNSETNKFTISNNITAFFFIDNGRNITAYYQDIRWIFFYVNYGKLYNWYTIEPSRTGDNSFLSSDDWKVPTDNDWDVLEAYCIASSVEITSSNVANYLKSRRQNGSPLGGVFDTTDDPYYLANATHYGLDTFRFGSVARGIRSGSNGAFGSNGRSLRMCSSETDETLFPSRTIRYDQGTISKFDGFKKGGGVVNLVRSATETEQLEDDGTVVDVYYQNNGYPLKCVKIGTQVWTSEVFETKWRDGSEIPKDGASGVFSDAEWAALTTPGVCDFNDDETLSFITTFAPLFDKYSGNPVINKGEEGSWDSEGVRSHTLLVDPEGNLVQENSKYIMYFTGKSASNVRQIGRAESTDKFNWTKYESNPIFNDDDDVSLGSVIKRGESDYIMYYSYDGATKFNYATSTDGVSFSKNTVGNPILEISDVSGAITMGQIQVVKIGTTQYMVFEVSEPTFYICMFKATDWITFSSVGQIYTATSGYFDDVNQANPTLLKADDNYYIIIYNGNRGDGLWELGILHSNSIESGWKRYQDAPVLYRGEDGDFDDTRVEHGRVYRDSLQTNKFKMWYFGLPTADSFDGGAIGIAIAKSGLKFDYEEV